MPSRSPTAPRQVAPPAQIPPARHRRLVLAVGLLSAGFLASALTPPRRSPLRSDDQRALIREGKQLYDTSCITCHGANLQGVQDRGPSLIGVGEAAVYFQVSTGRMPCARNEAQAIRKVPKFDAAADRRARRLHPGQRRRPDGHPRRATARSPSLAARRRLGRGGELFRLNCASCHNFTGRGGALSSGKFAPTLDPANEQQIYAAMLTGPQNMPKFSDRQLTPEEKKDIIAYIKSVERRRRTPAATASAASARPPRA